MLLSNGFGQDAVDVVGGMRRQPRDIFIRMLQEAQRQHVMVRQCSHVGSGTLPADARRAPRLVGDLLKGWCCFDGRDGLAHGNLRVSTVNNQ